MNRKLLDRIILATWVLVLASAREASSQEQVSGILTPSRESQVRTIAAAGVEAEAIASPIANDKLPRRHVERAEQAAGPSGIGDRREAVADGMSTWWPLIAVLGMIVVVALIARRWLPRARGLSPSGGIRVLSRHYLSGKQSLCMIRLGRRIVLLGITPENIQTLVSIDDPEEAALLTGRVEQSRPGSFARTLSEFDAADKAAKDEFPDLDESLALEKPLAQSSLRISQSLERLRQFVARNSAEPV